MSNIHFHYDQITILEGEEKYKAWLEKCLKDLQLEADSLTYVFTTDQQMLEQNKKQLDHDYYTDILTFDLRDSLDEPLFADIIISIDRVLDHSKKFNVSFAEELKRVMIHGVLHLIGYDDHSDADREKMRAEESRLINI